MKIVKEKLLIAELREMAKKMHGGFVKAMVDIQKNIIALDAPLHADLLELLMQEESVEPRHLWGINIYPDKTGEDFIEFDSMMNIKPNLGNRTRDIESEEIKKKIIEIIAGKIKA